jgi:hypothetical protein
MERVLGNHRLWAVIIDCNCILSGKKSNHSIQTPLLLVKEPRTRDNIKKKFKYEMCDDVSWIHPNEDRGQ